MGSAEAILKWRQCRTSVSAEKPRLINYICISIFNFNFSFPFSIDLIGEEFAPKRSQQQQPSVIVETIDSGDTNGTSSITPVSTMSSQQLGPNVVFVNSTGGSGVPLQVQQIIQQAQQQVK